MKSKFDLREIWNCQKAMPTSVLDFKHELKLYNKKKIRNIILTNILLILTTIYLLFIWKYFQPKQITTTIGIFMIVVAMITFIIPLNKTIVYYKENFDLDNSQYLMQLIALKNKQKHLQTTMLKIYFALLSIGLCLSLFEYIRCMNMIVGVFVFATIFLWILLNWFYIRPKTVRKQNAKLDAMIHSLEDIKKQFV